MHQRVSKAHTGGSDTKIDILRGKDTPPLSPLDRGEIITKTGALSIGQRGQEI